MESIRMGDHHPLFASKVHSHPGAQRLNELAPDVRRSTHLAACSNLRRSVARTVDGDEKGFSNVTEELVGHRLCGSRRKQCSALPNRRAWCENTHHMSDAMRAVFNRLCTRPCRIYCWSTHQLPVAPRAAPTRLYPSRCLHLCEATGRSPCYPQNPTALLCQHAILTGLKRTSA